MEDTPVVMLQGPRQCGKTTLVQDVARHLPYVTLDDSLALEAALRNPTAFLRAYPDGVVLDEVQRAPDLFRAIKAEVDRSRKPGRYVVTGSSNLLTLPRLTESLAGRMEVLSLWPLSQSEMAGGSGSLLDDLFAGRAPMSPGKPFGLHHLVEGGFPEPLGRTSPARKQAWHEGYLKALIERDIRGLSDIEGLASLPRLLRLLARCAGETINVAALSRDSGIPHTTLQRYLGLLESVFLIWAVPAWQSGLSHRVIKADRLAFVDSGVCLSLLGLDVERLSPYDPLTRGLLSAWAAMEFRKMAGWSGSRLSIHHFRSVRQYEVPIVALHPDGRMLAFDVTSEAAPGKQGFRALEFLQQVAGDRWAGGFLLHAGPEAAPYAEGLSALPLSSLSR